MKFIKSKTQIRRELAQEVEEFLHAGGAVKTIPAGVSGNETNRNVFTQRSSFEPRQDRTPLADVVKELENRKANKHLKSSVKPRKLKPRKKVITDDFGEPLRWIWDEE